MYTIEHLFTAARENNVAELEMIVKQHHISINAQGTLSAKDLAVMSKFPGLIPTGNDFTALHIACLHGHVDIVKKCVELGADVNPNCTTSPLHFTVMSNSIPILNYLLTHGADASKTAPVSFNIFPKNHNFSFTNSTSSTPKATQSTPNYNVKLLADFVTAIQNKADVAQIKQFIQAKTHEKDTKGSTLYFALTTNQTDVVKLLLNAGIKVQDKHIYAAGCANSQPLYELIKTHKTVDINAKQATNHSSSPSNNQNIALQTFIAAIKLNKANTIPASLKDDIQHQDSKGSALYFALTQGNITLVTSLLNCGIKVLDKHLFAAGCYQQVSTNESGTSKQLYELLKANKPNLASNINHEILGVPEDATVKRIKIAYGQLVLQYHPDKNNNSPASQEMFIKIEQAYQMMRKNADINATAQSSFFNRQTPFSDTHSSTSYGNGFSYR